MKLFLIVNSGFEELCSKEVKELIGKETKINHSVLEVDVDKQEAIDLAYHLQSARRILVAFESVSDFNQLEVGKVELKDLFTSELSFKVEIENVKGNDNRLAIAKVVAGKIFASLDKLEISPKLELKKPDSYVIVYFNGKDYFVGLDLVGKEINNREYRIFTSPASFKGDLAYHFVRVSRFESGQKLLVGLAKDGTIAIEAAIFANYVCTLGGEKYSFNRVPLFSGLSSSLDKKQITKVFSVDTTMQNVTATRKNSILAGTRDLLEVQKYALDEWDVKFNEKEFDCIIAQITSKDEEKLNELYYQTSYLLKSGGMLLLIGRKNWELTISSKFKLVEEKEIIRGESAHKYCLLKRQ